MLVVIVVIVVVVVFVMIFIAVLGLFGNCLSNSGHDLSFDGGIREKINIGKTEKWKIRIFAFLEDEELDDSWIVVFGFLLSFYDDICYLMKDIIVWISILCDYVYRMIFLMLKYWKIQFNNNEYDIFSIFMINHII